MGTTNKTIGLLAAGAAILGMSTVALAAPKDGSNGKGGGEQATSSIALNQEARLSAELQLGNAVTYTTSIEPLKGSEWPMVYTECRSIADGSVLYGQLDHPDALFVLGGGSSPWLGVGGDATCDASLLAYGGKVKGVDTIRLLASTGPFGVTG